MKPKRQRFEPKTRRWARKAVFAIVYETYKSWLTRLEIEPKSREPSLTVAWLTDYLDQVSRPVDYKTSPRSWRSALVRSICESLAGKGDFTCTYGASDRGEARCYEPVRVILWCPVHGEAGGVHTTTMKTCGLCMEENSVDAGSATTLIRRV